MPLILARPLVCFDLETTGLDVNTDRIVELSCLKLNPDFTREHKTWKINPTVPIPKTASDIHHITDVDVINEPTFAAIHMDILYFINGCDLTGFNVIKYDIPMLQNEFRRVGKEYPDKSVKVIDSLKIYRIKEPRNLTAAYKLYCNKDLVGAHGAEADTSAALDVLISQVELYPDLPSDVEQLEVFSNPKNPLWLDEKGLIVWNSSNEACINFGKYRGITLQKIKKTNPGYFEWMLKGDFSKTVKDIARRAYNNEFPMKEIV
jgi:DNA polymerase III subunit epsilon